MPHIGIIRGFGEGYNATGYIIKIVKALNRRFRSKIIVEEICLGDYFKYGCDLKSEEISRMRGCDAVYVGDMQSNANPLSYTVNDIAMALDNSVEYTCISGMGNHGSIDVMVASYFDGGTNLRYNVINTDGCSETRVCSKYTVMNVVKTVSRSCENRRRRLAFVKDADNEYCANMFYAGFEDFALPMSNFQLVKFSIPDITYEILYNPSQFDTIFASKSFSDYAWGIYRGLLKDDFAAYTKYAKSKTVYSVKGLYGNSAAPGEAASICSYITALGDMLREEFCMNKESEHLRMALDAVLKDGISPSDTEDFVLAFIQFLDKPVEKKHSKKTPKIRYIK